MVAMIYSFSGIASADDEVPDSCNGSIEKQAYNSGFLSGSSIVEMAWLKLDQCDLVERFETIVLNILASMAIPEGSSTYVACRYAGFANGVMAEVDKVYQYCQGLCYYEGEIIGQMVAETYCMLSLALGGLATADDFIRAPVQICGFHFELACDVTYLFETITYVHPITYGICEPYTHGDYWVVWDQVRNNQCAYNIMPPEELPPRDRDW